MNLQEYISNVESNISNVQKTFANYVRTLKQLESTPEILLTDFYALLENPIFSVADWGTTTSTDVFLPILRKIPEFSEFYVTGGIKCISLGVETGENFIFIEPQIKTYHIVLSKKITPISKTRFWESNWRVFDKMPYHIYLQYYDILKTCDTSIMDGLKMLIHGDKIKIPLTKILKQKERRESIDIAKEKFELLEYEYQRYLEKVEYKNSIEIKYKDAIDRVSQYLDSLGYLGKSKKL